MLNGLRLDAERGKIPRGLKKQLYVQQVSREQVDSWFGSVRDLSFSLATIVEDGVKDSLAMFHDVQTSASAVIRNSEELLARLPGRDEEEKLASLPSAATSLIKAADLLRRRLALMPLVVNPEAATFGAKRSMRVFRLLESLVRTMRATSDAVGVSLRLNGQSYRSVSVFDSFDTIPLVILENAIKYSPSGQTVEIDVNDAHPAGVSVVISSFSPWIPTDERTEIFTKGYRGYAATRVSSQGAGIGLFLAKVVASAHGIAIRHSTDEKDIRIGGIRYCTNHFAFVVT